MVLLTASACSTSPTGKTTIAVLLPPAGGDIGLLKAGLEAGVRNSGFRLVFGPEAASLAQERRFLAELNPHSVAAIVLTPVSPDESLTILQEIHLGGIHIVCYQSCVDAEGISDAFIPGAQREAGRLAGDKALEYIISQLGGEATVGILPCLNSDCAARQAGFAERLKLLPGVEVVVGNNSRVDKAVEDLMYDHPQTALLYAAGADQTSFALPIVQEQGKVVVIGAEMNSNVFHLLNTQTPGLKGVAFALDYQAGFALAQTAIALQQDLPVPDYAGALAVYATPADNQLAKDYLTAQGKFILPSTTYQPLFGQPTLDCNCKPEAHPVIPTPP
jgi:simple sugar transport system substrate-binding protein